MVILTIKELDLDNGVDHVATDWQVSDTMNFSHIVCESERDYKHLRGIIFNETLDPNQKYYARARALTSNGYTIWGNLDVFTVDNTVELDKNEDLPSNVSIPVIKTKNSDGYLDPNSHDTTLFNIEATGFSVVGNAKLDSTSYWIEDIYGNVVWSSIYNILSKDEITVHDVILKANSIYRIKVMFHATNNNSSQIATTTIRTNGGSGVEVSTFLDNLDSTQNQEIEISTPVQANKIKYDVISYKSDYSQSIYKGEVQNNNKFTIPARTMQPNTNYLLKVGIEEVPGYKFIPFITL